MSMDNLAIVNRIIEEHGAIRSHLKLIGDTVNDRESLAVLAEIRSGWVPGRLDILVNKQKQLRQAAALLTEGLNNHFYYEEKTLPSLLGESLMRAILLDHQEIKKELAHAGQLMEEGHLEGLSREEILVSELRIQQVANSIARIIEEHASREEVLLKMLQRGLREKPGS